jgi:hypothetical protein
MEKRTSRSHSRFDALDPTMQEGQEAGSPTDRHSAVRRVDRACQQHDPAMLARGICEVIALAPAELAIDLVAVSELAGYDLELAELRWNHLRGRLA